MRIPDCEFTAAKEEMEAQEIPLLAKSSKDDLPMEYVTALKLQKLEGEANQTTVRKLVGKMAQDGFVEGKGNRRLGKRVIRWESANRKKLQEIKKDLAFDNHTSSAMEIIEPNNKSKDAELQTMGCKTKGHVHLRRPPLHRI